MVEIESLPGLIRSAAKAALAAQPQKAVLQPAAPEKIVELALHMLRQRRALRRQVRGEGRIVRLDEPIEQGALGPVPLVLARRQAGRGAPCRARVSHVSRPCEPVRIYS